MHCGFITTLNNVRVHPNADKLVLATCFVNTVCVAKDKYTEGEIGVYFPVDLQLSMEFCEKNGLLAVYENGKNISGGYMDPAKRNVKAIKLRGEQSDGLFLPLSCVEYTGVKLDTLKIGDKITTLNGHEICRKYIPIVKAKKSAFKTQKSKKTSIKYNVAPTFFEHKDTEQLAYNLNAFKPGDAIEITRKLHGTSGRTSYTKVLKGFKRSLLDRIFRRPGTPIYDWGYVSGTRRTVLNDFDGGFYGSNEFRKQYHDLFENKLLKGETVYYEIVGFTHTGQPIMSICNNKKTNDKDFIKKYGETTIFSYGCVPTGEKMMYGEDEHGSFSIPVKAPQSDIYVYRMTMTTEDGEVIEYTPDQVRERCMFMGVKTVPLMAKAQIGFDGSISSWQNFETEEDMPSICIGNETVLDDPYSFKFNPGQCVLKLAEKFYDGEEPIDPTHIREGVVVRIVNRPVFTAYKHKSFNFKLIEGIIKESAETPDMEEADGLELENIE